MQVKKKRVNLKKLTLFGVGIEGSDSHRNEPPTLSIRELTKQKGIKKGLAYYVRPFNVGVEGFEPPTLPLSKAGCPNQLS